MKGLVSGIKRMEIHDGAGLRTTVFLKGCSLKCVWCHNPESIGFQPSLAFFKDKCVGCGTCVSLCKNGGIAMDGLAGKPVIDREKCRTCFTCADHCPTGALKGFGQEYT
ncbi:MAG: 4Fe-4S binding protein, partial [Lachnospiraceae bacterium]|nr:4Fe-4S binding protein [Lachnospiraceae bacterium]